MWDYREILWLIIMLILLSEFETVLTSRHASIFCWQCKELKLGLRLVQYKTFAVFFKCTSNNCTHNNRETVIKQELIKTWYCLTCQSPHLISRSSRGHSCQRKNTLYLIEDILHVRPMLFTSLPSLRLIFSLRSAAHRHPFRCAIRRNSFVADYIRQRPNNRLSHHQQCISARRRTLH